MAGPQTLSDMKADLASLKTDMGWVKLEIAEQTIISNSTARDVAAIHMMMAREQEKRKVVRYFGHAAAIGLGAILATIVGIFSPVASAAITKHLGL